MWISFSSWCSIAVSLTAVYAQTQQCNITGPSPPPQWQNLQCSFTGSLRYPVRLENPLFMQTFDACKYRCVTTPYCASFGFDAPSSPPRPNCRLFARRVRKMGFDPTRGKTRFSNRLCYKKACPPPACTDTPGLEWAYYHQDPEVGNDNESGQNYQFFDPSTYATRAPSQTGAFAGIGGWSDDGTTEFAPYGMTSVYKAYSVLNHRGYIRAVRNDTWTIRVASVDDILELWIGDAAVSGMNRSTELWERTYGTGAGSKTFAVRAGEYTPIRILYANGNGAAALKMSITNSDGYVVLNSTGAHGIVTKSCGAAAGAPGNVFADWPQ